MVGGAVQNMLQQLHHSCTLPGLNMSLVLDTCVLHTLGMPHMPLLGFYSGTPLHLQAYLVQRGWWCSAKHAAAVAPLLHAPWTEYGLGA